MQVCIGELKWFSVGKGWGYVHSDAGDVMIHVKSTRLRRKALRKFKERALQGKAMRIQYSPTSTHDGLRAEWWRWVR